MFTHKCELCGVEFQSKSNRAKYCIYCRDKAQAARNRVYAEKKKSGTSVPIGSEQICPICNKPYTVTSGSQKYCKECTKKQKQASKGQPSAEYIKENYDYIRFNVPKGEGNAINAKVISAETIARVLDGEAMQQNETPAETAEPEKKSTRKKPAAKKPKAKTTDKPEPKKPGRRKKKSDSPADTAGSQTSRL